MPCHAPRPSPAPAGRNAALDAAMPCAARKQRGIVWGDGRGATGSKGGAGALGGITAAKMPPPVIAEDPRPTRSDQPASERGQLSPPAKRNLAAGIGAGGALWVSGMGAGRRCTYSAHAVLRHV